jgi:hypothetical protein
MPNHSTAGTFAFKRELLDITKYDDVAAVAEEKAFLRLHHSVYQLDPLKTILVVSQQRSISVDCWKTPILNFKTVR